MATRAASATIVQSDICSCPPGMLVYGKRGHIKMKAGRSSYARQNIFTWLIVPNYFTAGTAASITVNEIPQGHRIIVPISMIKEHVDCCAWKCISCHGPRQGPKILEGYYSDPPDLYLYTTRLQTDGVAMRNNYGMQMIECSRGTVIEQKDITKTLQQHLAPGMQA